MFYLFGVPTATLGSQDMAHAEGKNHLGPKSPTSLGQEPREHHPEGLCVLAFSLTKP